MRIRTILLIGIISVSVSALAQNIAPEKSKVNQAPSSSIKVVDLAIPISAIVTDSAIQKRLTDIMVSIGKFSHLQVVVSNGIVTLGGTAQSKSALEWALAVSENMDGVIGVVNNIEYKAVDTLSTKNFISISKNLFHKGLNRMPLIIAAVFVLTVFFFSASPVAKTIMRPIGLMTQSALIRMVSQRIITIFIMLVGFYFFLKIAGLTQFALAVISGTGVVGLILGFAFKDIAENFISSLLISAQRPFRLGDVIQVEGHKGVVRKVTARGTTLVDFDGNHIQIPNAIIYKNILQNFSANPKLRGSFRIGIGYDASITLAQRIGIELMLEHEAILSDPEPQVLVDSLGPSTVNLIVYYWVNGDVYAVNKVSSLLMRSIMRAFENGGITMPDDAREIIFPQGLPVTIQKDTDDAENLLPPGSNYKNTRKSRLFTSIEETDHHETLKSDTDDIKQQAAAARDPEEGGNII